METTLLQISGSRLLKPPRPGDWGEYYTGLFLLAQGWEILHQRWRCRWGEIDIIARRDTPDPWLAFVEVKTRRSRSWDDGGLFSITPQKQAKLWRTAQMFLAEHEDLSPLPCRFDVALVTYRHRPVSDRDGAEVGANGLYPLLRSDFGLKRAKHLGNRLSVTSDGFLAEMLSPLQTHCPKDIGQPVDCGPYQLTLHQYLEAAFTFDGFDN